MPSEVAIANLAVAHVGNSADISSLTEGSRMASLCRQFLPIARDALLEMHAWDFATKRVSLALTGETVNGWAFAYARPSDCLKVLAVLPPQVLDDYSAGPAAFRGTISTPSGLVSPPYPSGYTAYQPQAFTTELSPTTGAQLILANQEEAMARCIFRITDTTRFSPLFTECLSRLLASYIAGPVYKGTEGIKVSQAMLAAMQKILSTATVSSAGQEYNDVQVSTPWISGR